MVMQRMAVIGGTGLLNMATGQPFNDAGLEVLATDSFDVETPYGIVPLKSFTLKHSSEEKTLVFLQRHHNAGSASKPPHMIHAITSLDCCCGYRHLIAKHHNTWQAHAQKVYITSTPHPERRLVKAKSRYHSCR